MIPSTGRCAATKYLQRAVSARSRLPPLQASASACIDPTRFNAEHLALRQPGLFRGLVSHPDTPYRWPACTQWPGLPSSSTPLDGLRKVVDLQQAIVEVEVARMGRGYGDGVRSWQQQVGSTSGWTQIRMPFNLFHDAFLDGSVPSDVAPGPDGRAPRPMVGYVAQQDLFEVAPTLAQHCPPLPHAVAGVRGAREQWRRNVWIGGAGTFTPIHCDPYENLFVQVSGTKRVHLFPPHVRASLDLFDAAKTQQANTSAVRTEAPLLEVQSDDGQVEVEESLVEWPALETAMRDKDARHVVLEAGDVLYVPQGWFHCIASLSVSASVNAWFR